MQWFPDITTFLKDAGLPLTLAFLFGYILFRYVILNKLKTLLSSHDVAVDKIDKITETATETNQIVKSISSRYDEHVAETRRALGDEPWRHCPVDRCPNLGKVINFLEQISREIKDFAEGAKESRNVTQGSIVDVSEKIDMFINSLGSEFIATLRDMRKDK